ncbi:helix-turn-helix domain-containing protein [Laspinema sp. D1]|uniref:Helix-turn-helix domain-containing protein n=1 Tax=Laspinema palackyanum D2a TaxID=2953684 RepID=A0ABT2MWG1_9CYAN|nr:helix-turn-helix domain-containing protein [Laspinema sp. D2a]
MRGHPLPLRVSLLLWFPISGSRVKNERTVRIKVAALVNGKLSAFSTTRLFRFLNALGRDVEIVVKPKSFRQAETRVVGL